MRKIWWRSFRGPAVEEGRMFKKWRPEWCYGIFPRELPWLRKRSGFVRQIGFMHGSEW
jgi:hypothetical protein